MKKMALVAFALMSFSSIVNAISTSEVVKATTDYYPVTYLAIPAAINSFGAWCNGELSKTSPVTGAASAAGGLVAHCFRNHALLSDFSPNAKLALRVAATVVLSAGTSWLAETLLNPDYTLKQNNAKKTGSNEDDKKVATNAFYYALARGSVLAGVSELALYLLNK
jgi:hypothetical protein